MNDRKSLYELALEEDALWRSLSPGERKLHRQKAIFISNTTYCSVYSARMRGELLRTPGSLKLWPRLDNGTMTYATAKKLLGQAAALSTKKNIGIEDAVDRLLGNEVEDPPKVNGQFWLQIRKMINEYVDSRIPDGSVIDTEPFKKAIEADLKSLADEYVNKICRRAQTVSQVTDRKFKQACAVLQIDPPRKSKTFDLARAKKQKRLLARAYHPDSNGGDESLREQYEAVLEAYLVVESWYLQRESK